MSRKFLKVWGYDFTQRFSFFGLLWVLGVGLFFAGCSSLGSTYYEQYTVDGVQVVILDEGALHKKWTELSGEKAASFDLKTRSDGGATLQVVRGFFDPSTQTMYCTSLDVEVCRRELHQKVVAHGSEQVVVQSHTH